MLGNPRQPWTLDSTSWTSNPSQILVFASETWILDSNRYGILHSLSCIPHFTVKVSQIWDSGIRNPESLAWTGDALIKRWVQRKFAAIDEVELIVIFTFK